MKTLDITFFGKTTKYWIKKERGVWLLCSYRKDGNSTYRYDRYLNPLRTIYARLCVFCIEMYVKLLHKPKCEGCGLGVQEYIIENPNHPINRLPDDKEHWRVCKHCVDFYDWNWSKEKIK